MLKRGPLMVLILLLGMYGPISTDMFLAGLPDMITELGTDEPTITMTMYCFLISLAVSALFMGPLSDKYGRRYILTISMVVYTVMSVACALSTSVWMLIVFRVFQAVGGGGALAISIALVKDCFRGQDMFTVMSFVAVIGVLGPVLSPVIGTVIITFVDWRATFWAPAMLGLFCLLLGLGLSKNLPEKRFEGSVVGAVGSLMVVLKNRDFAIMAVMMTGQLLPMLAYVGVSSYVYQIEFGTSELKYTAMLAGAVFTSIFALPVLRRFVLRTHRSVLPLQAALYILAVFLLLAVGYRSEYWFMLSVIPLVIAPAVARASGFGILMIEFEENNGAVSSVLNFLVFAFGCLGMLIASQSFWDSFKDGILFCEVVALVTYLALWGWLRARGYRLKAFNGPSAPDNK